jgi:trans-2,3-dihydro-3-hydroxyanthranilate isomerase
MAAALGLDHSRLGPHAPGAFEGGPAFLFVQVADLAALAEARSTSPGWGAMMRVAGIDDTGRSAVGVYVYADDGPGRIRARMFAPDDGIREDPATGSATAILSAQLLANGALAEGETVLSLQQGVEMGRPSDLRLSIDVAKGAITAIRVAGRAVKVAQGTIAVPAG